MSTLSKKQKRDRRHTRIRAKVSGTSEMPRLSVFKSNTALYAQLIDDVAQKTLAAVTSNTMKGKTGLEKAKALGTEIAKLAMAKGVTKIVFDRGGYIYTGKVQAIAEGAREAGLKF